MSHLETLIAEYLEWQGFLVRRNTKVGKLGHGGWEMELDIIGYHPKSGLLVHYEPSIDALSWTKREARYIKKFQAARKYIFKEIFTWLPATTPLQQIAVFISHPKNRHTIAGGTILSIDELMAEIRAKVVACGIMAKNAVPERFPVWRSSTRNREQTFRQADLPGLIRKPIISADQRRPKPLQMKGFEFGSSVALRLSSSRVRSQAIRPSIS